MKKIVIFLALVFFCHSEKYMCVRHLELKVAQKKLSQIITNRHKPKGADKWPGKINLEY